MDTASSDGVCHHAAVGHLPLVWPCAGCSSFMATNLPHGALFRWLRWPTSTINQKNIFAFNRMHHKFTFMHQFRVILDMHPLTKFKQCLSLQYNLQLIKPQNKWLQLFNIFINFPPLITFSIKSFIKTCHCNLATCSIFINPHETANYPTPYS